MPVAGEYRGRLDNDGERVTLTFGGNLTILDFAYDDSWYPITDGWGHSLDVVNPSSPASDWQDPAAWIESELVHGTPGLPPSGVPPAGGRQRVGDANQDGAIDLSDAIALLRHLFVGDVGAPPCEGASVQDGGNRRLLDASGDDVVDITDAIHVLSFLFKGGIPPGDSTACIRIEGCPDVCGRP
jgi:hypothetical protein